MFERTRNNIISLIFAIALVILIISFSIGLPIYNRTFYYIHVLVLDLPEETGYEYSEITEAYDEVLDYLTIDGKEFGTGILEHSEEGKAHFEDCKKLFDLNKNALIISLAIVILLIVFDKVGLITLARPCGLRLGFWSSIVTLSLFSFVGLACAVNFDSAFTTFHKLFFPGKSNWMFDPYADEIILVLPQQFFLSCAVLICVSVLLISAILIARAIIKRNDEYAWRV